MQNAVPQGYVLGTKLFTSVATLSQNPQVFHLKDTVRSCWRTVGAASHTKSPFFFLTFLNSTNNKIHIQSELWDAWSKAECASLAGQVLVACAQNNLILQHTWKCFSTNFDRSRHKYRSCVFQVSRKDFEGFKNLFQRFLQVKGPSVEWIKIQRPPEDSVCLPSGGVAVPARLKMLITTMISKSVLVCFHIRGRIKLSTHSPSSVLHYQVNSNPKSNHSLLLHRGCTISLQNKTPPTVVIYFDGDDSALSPPWDLTPGTVLPVVSY